MIIKDERPEITAAVHAEYGNSLNYRRTIIAGAAGVALGGSADDRIDQYSNGEMDYDAYRAVDVLNGNILR